MSSAAMHVQAAACLSPPEVVGAPLTPEDICQRSKGNWSDAKAVPGAKSGSVESAQSVAIVPKRPHAAGRAIARTPSSIVKRSVTRPTRTAKRREVGMGECPRSVTRTADIPAAPAKVWKYRGKDHFIYHRDTIDKIIELVVTPETRRLRYRARSCYCLLTLLKQDYPELFHGLRGGTLKPWFIYPGVDDVEFPTPTPMFIASVRNGYRTYFCGLSHLRKRRLLRKQGTT